MSYDEAAGVLLANRLFLYRYLWRAFAAEPDDAFLAVAKSNHPDDACALVSSDATLIQQDIAEAVRSGIAAGPEGLSSLRAQYTRLFVGPASLPAPPWESVYACGDNLLFQASTLDVRADYRSAGFVAAGSPHEADDHLATELDFMATLAEQSCQACEAGDGDAVRAGLESQRSFLEHHLGVWVKRFAERLEAHAGEEVAGFYGAFTRLCVEVCRYDAEVLPELIDGC